MEPSRADRLTGGWELLCCLSGHLWGRGWRAHGGERGAARMGPQLGGGEVGGMQTWSPLPVLAWKLL